MHSGTKKVDDPHCFHCGTLIYDISVLYGEKFTGELYCTHCNISIKDSHSEL